MSANTRKGISLFIGAVTLGLLILVLLTASPLPAAAQESPRPADIDVLDPYPAPTSVTATDGTFFDRIRILWDSLVQADYYEIFRANSADGQKTLAGTSTTVLFEDTAVNAETLYYYWVRACNPEDCSELSAYDSGWRQLNIPDVPASVQASDGAFADRVQVSWAESSPATYYEIYRAEAVDGARTLVKTLTEPPFEDRDASIEFIYYYWVIACGVDGCSDFSTYDSGFRAMPAVPGGLQASDGAYLDRVSLNWDPSFGSNFYEVYRAESLEGEKSLVTRVTAPEADDLEAEFEVVYYYWVKGCVIDACSGFSAFDTGWRALPQAPMDLQASDGTYLDRIEVKWSPVTGVDYYELYRAGSPASPKELVSTQVAILYEDLEVEVEEQYTYWVKACVVDGCSSFSAPDSGYRALPSAPLNLAASDGLYTDKILITWNSAYGAEYYELYRADLPSGTRLLRTTLTENQFADTNLPVQQTFFYWVKACNADGCSPYSLLDSGFIAVETPVFQLYTPLVLRYSQGNPQP